MLEIAERALFYWDLNSTAKHSGGSSSSVVMFVVGTSRDVMHPQSPAVPRVRL